jgi:uncharacterized protein (DUF1501 family)
VRFVTLTFGGWDMHSSIERAMRNSGAMMDSAVATLIDDLSVRGMLDTTMVIVMGEFGRTPRLNTGGVPGADPVPGRDHWGEVMSVLVAGGGVRGGQVIGVTDRLAAYPVTGRQTPENLAATIYHALGIPRSAIWKDVDGRPYELYGGDPIPGLLGGRSAFRRGQAVR